MGPEFAARLSACTSEGEVYELVLEYQARGGLTLSAAELQSMCADLWAAQAVAL